MPNLKKRMRQALALFFSLVFIVAPVFTTPPKVFAADLCCPSGFVLADGGPGAIWNCGVGPDAYNTNTCCKRGSGGIITGHEVAASFACTTDTSGATQVTCEWTRLNNPSSPYHNKPAFCFGGFKSRDDLRSHSLELGCEGTNCGGILSRLLQSANGGGVQRIPLSVWEDENIGTNNNGTNYACVTGDIDQSVIEYYNSLLNNTGAQCAISILGGVAVSVTTGGFAIPVAVGTAGAVCANAISQPGPNIVGRVINGDGGTSCTANANFSLDPHAPPPQDQVNNNTFDLCNQIPDPNLKSQCQQCAGNSRNPTAIWTSVGCIPTTSTGIVSSLVKVGLGIAGTAALLMILAGGFMLSTSQGDTKRVGEARELITSAVIGLLFIIFSVTLLQFVGVTIFQIPGFGS